MSKISIVLFAVGTLIAATQTFAADRMGKEAHKAAKDQADATYKADKKQCDQLSGNAKDVCVAEAKAKQKIAKADAEADYKGTRKARTEARNARAEAEYAVAKEKCDDLAGNPKDVCIKEAKAARTRAKADAKANRTAGDAQDKASRRTSEARRDAADDKRDADYKVEAEKCDALAGESKGNCLKNARAKFGR